jgi:choline dehydrogenase-like flavoprotein
MLPNDLRLRSAYGVGRDWPVTYDELEPYYCEAERMMAASGPEEAMPSPRSEPYPQPPHLFSEPDKLLKAAFPSQYFAFPTARARVSTANRPMCCANGVCHLCPVNARYTVMNEMRDLYDDPRITLELGATVQTIETEGNIAKGVTYIQENLVHTAQADLIVLGANGIFNPHLLLRSGFEHPLLGKRLHEQVSIWASVDIDGVDNFQGSTSITGYGYMFYDGPHRAERAACAVESYNVVRHGVLRTEPGKWRQRLIFKFVIEDMPDERNYVQVYDADPTYPKLVYEGHSDYAQRTLEALPTFMPELLKPFRVEKITFADTINTSEYHIQGTTVMGNDPAESVIDRYLMHHQVRNLLVLGSGAFPTCSPANPTLTLCALTLWAVDHL